MSGTAARVAKAISDDLLAHPEPLEAAGLAQIVVTVKLDAAGCPRSVETITETRRAVERPWPSKRDPLTRPDSSA